MMNRWRSGGLLLLAAAFAVMPSRRVQAQSTDDRWTGSAELGWRAFVDRPDAQHLAKFEEYRDYGPGAFLQSVRFGFQPRNARVHYDFTATDALRRDQSLAGRARVAGLFDLRLGWDKIPHTFSTDARLVSGAGTGTDFSLPSTLTRTLADTTAWQTAPFLGPVRSGWDVAQAVLTFTPGTNNDLKVDFTNIAKSGGRPLSMSLNGTSLFREIVEPLDQSVRDLKLSESYVRRRFQVQVAYNLNAFDNANASVSAANPLVATSSTAGSSVSRAGLAPSNLAQTFTVAGGLNLPFRTRVNSTVSYGRRSQNAPFLPYTSNAALVDPRLANEPASLKGAVTTVLANLTATTRPVRDVSVTGRYRYWDFRDRTPTFTSASMPVQVFADRSISAWPDTVVIGERLPYSKQNAGLDAHWTPVRTVGVQVGYAWERWDRSEELDVSRTNEYTPRVALDLNPSEWMTLRASFASSRRRGNGYVDGAANSNFDGFRRFYEADRNRDRFNALAQFAPSDRVAISADYTLGRDRYPDTRWGIQSDRNAEVGGDVSYMVSPRMTIFGSYTYELDRLAGMNRYRDGQNRDNLTYQYTTDERDLMQTAGLGLTGTLVPNKVDVEVRWDRARGATLVASRNPQTPVAASGTPAQQASSVLNATATDFPEITHTWTPFHASLRYNVTSNWSGTLGFAHDQWDSYDFRTSGLGTLVFSNRTPVTLSGVPLGNDLLPYTANYLTFTISFRPKAAQPVIATPIL